MLTSNSSDSSTCKLLENIVAYVVNRLIWEFINSWLDCYIFLLKGILVGSLYFFWYMLNIYQLSNGMHYSKHISVSLSPSLFIERNVVMSDLVSGHMGRWRGSCRWCHSEVGMDQSGRDEENPAWGKANSRAAAQRGDHRWDVMTGRWCSPSSSFSVSCCHIL